MQQLSAERTAIQSRKEQFKRALDQRKPLEKDDFAQRPNQSQDGYVEADTGGQPASPQPAKPDRKAINWWKRNDWFHGESNEDRIMTSTALQINQELLDEGYDPNEDADEYYNALDSRLVSEFPKLKKGRKMAGKGSPVSGGGRAGPRKGTKGKVRITESMKARAERLGVPLEDYARQVQKLRDEGKDI